MPTEESAEQNQNGEQEQQVETPARAGTRTSGRVRKTPKRFEEEAVTPSRRKPATTPSKSARGTRSAQKPKKSPVHDEEDEDDEPDFEDEDEEEAEDDDDDEDEMDVDEHSPKPARRSVTRTRSKRSTAKPRASKKVEQRIEKSASPEYQDGLDDILAMQLQQGLPQDEPESHEASEIIEPLPEYAEKLQSLCQADLNDEARILSNIVLEKLSGKRQVPIRGLEPEYQKVHQLIEQTVSIGEGNSMLVLGSRGCGKTAIVETIISSLRKEHHNDFHVVRLNGFFHTDDRLALRDMWRQLGREMHTEDDAAKVSSYADTMATLLALLSHPEELFGSSGDAGSKTAAKSIVILLDEFDLFVTHPRQTLLYNLFDIAQARKAPIAVIGLTTKVDVTEMLEKRVKSRFSHRYTYVPLPRSFEDFSDICLASLDLGDAEMADIVIELGDDRRLVESAKWKTLLGGWKEYLKVSYVFPSCPF
jgi:origin recognition complex subunit 4